MEKLRNISGKEIKIMQGNLIDKVLGSLNKGKVVTIHGSSGIGKSETMGLLRELFKKEGKKTVYLDMRHIKNHIQFYKEIAQQLEIKRKDQYGVYLELENGGITLLLDEYWAGTKLADQVVQFAHQKNNNIVTVAGNPMEVKLDEYMME